jgi:phospholipid/cholesterol/gamma-HCH transport system substrate-binding protein
VRTPFAGARRRATALVATALGGALVLSGCSVYDAPLPGGPDAGSNPITVKANFRDVLDLVPQSTVKVDDVSVGKVTKVSLKGYTAVVTMQLPRNIDLPDNATAQIRQTSLLGEKFVSLAQPQQPSSNKLANGDVIGLDRTGRNPEVEEVFSALALLLNGGGVGQLKTIAEELNTAFDGREGDVRSVLDQIRLFVGQLDQNKSSIVAAIENTNRLAGELRQQDGTIKATLDDVPDALRSIDRQRADLVKMLQALQRLSGVGVRVIQASKESTINSLRDLAPVLDKFAEAGQSFPKSFQVFLTYPFVDEAVGRDPQVARNLHMGDYTNLSVNLDINVADLPKLPGLPGQVCDTLAALRAAAKSAADQAVTTTTFPTPPFTEAQRNLIRNEIADRLIAKFQDQCQKPDANALGDYITKDFLSAVLKALNLDGLLSQLPGGLGGIVGGITGGVTGGLTGGGSGGGSGGGLLPRAQLGSDFQTPGAALDPFGLAKLGLDPGIGTMLLQGVAEVR